MACAYMRGSLHSANNNDESHIRVDIEICTSSVQPRFAPSDPVALLVSVQMLHVVIFW